MTPLVRILLMLFCVVGLCPAGKAAKMFEQNEKENPGKTAQDKPKPLVIVQVRDEVHLPGRTSSKHVDNYSSFVKDGCYHAENGLFRVRIPTLKSGKINLLRRRWESPDGVDVKFVDEAVYARAAFSFEPDSKPAHEGVKEKYLKYFANQNTKNEVKVIKTRFGDTVELVAMNWITTRDYPYDAPTIDVSKQKLDKIGPTVGIGWIFWKDKSQCGGWIVLPVEKTTDETAAFQSARQAMKEFAEGIEFLKK